MQTTVLVFYVWYWISQLGRGLLPLHGLHILGIAVPLLLLSGCAGMNRMVVNMVGDALSGSSDVFTGDSDPDLVREAIPFGLKTYESLLAVVPEHQGLLLSAASGFCSYAYLLKERADRLEGVDYPNAQHLRRRASKLFLRGREYALRGLEVRHPGFRTGVFTPGSSRLQSATRKDVDLLYWAGAGWAGALSTAKGNPLLIAELPLAGALVARVIELDEAFDSGSAHEFMISYEASRPGGDLAAARRHFARALHFSAGQRASVYVALAETVAIPEQDVAEFWQLLDAALAVDVDMQPEQRVANLVAQERALWLRTRTSQLFLDFEEN